MDDSKITKENLLERLEANRARHREVFELAINAYKDKMTDLLENLIERAKNGQVIPQKALYDLPMPEDHTNDYDVAIEQLKLDVRKKFFLSERDFRRFVMDQWEWQQSFTSNTVAYTTGAVR
jgi:hypothetical protein